MSNNLNHKRTGELQRQKRELRRLETLIDSVFALVIVLIVVDLPLPETAPDFDLVAFMLERLESLLIALVGIVVILVYWFQSNLLLGNLRHTNAMHATMSVLQIFFILVYLLTVSLGISVGNEPLVLATQSAAATLVGIAAAAAWWYASNKRRLLTDEISNAEVAALRLRVFAEPLTAVLTLGLAFIGPLAWELGWLAYPLVAALLRRAGVAQSHEKIS